MAESAFIFTDLVGYTAFTEAEGDEAAADLAEQFCERVDQLNGGHGAQDVKTLGDGCMIHVPNPGCAAELGLEIVESIAPEHGLPRVRVGIDCGPAVERGGDWYGATVNRAARLVDLADEGTVLVTNGILDVSARNPAMAFESRGSVLPKGFSDEVEVFVARRRDVADGGAHSCEPVAEARSG